MEQYLLENIVHLYYSKLTASSRRVEKKAGKEDIHQFRVEIKKLRAFYRLLSLETRPGKEMKLPRRLKKMYAAAGQIRDLQLQVKRAKDFFTEKGIRLTFLTGALKHTLKKHLEKRRPHLSKQYFRRCAEKAGDRLPLQLRAETLQRFFREKTDAIGHIMALGSFEPDELHTIRKNIKDMMYVGKIYKEDINSSLPMLFIDAAGWARMEALADDLGQYNDFRSCLDTAQQVAKDASGKDKKNIASYIDIQTQEQKTLRVKIISQLPAMIPKHDVPSPPAPVNAH